MIVDDQAHCLVARKYSSTGIYIGAGKKGAIQVDSPPLFLARPVGGRPDLTVVMYLNEHGFRQKVAKSVEITNKMQRLSYLIEDKWLNLRLPRNSNSRAAANGKSLSH
jgi:hypothetical protein